jgi:hypothetical protein
MATKKPSSSKPKPGGKSPGGKKEKGSAKGTIKNALTSKIEELVRTSELDMMLQRENLGLGPKGDNEGLCAALDKKAEKSQTVTVIFYTLIICSTVIAVVFIVSSPDSVV